MKWLALTALLFLTGCQHCCEDSQVIWVTSNGKSQAFICERQSTWKLVPVEDTDGARSRQAESN